MALPRNIILTRYTGLFDLDGLIKLRCQSADPSCPPRCSLYIYSKSVGGVSHLMFEDDACVVHDLSTLSPPGQTTTVTIGTPPTPVTEPVDVEGEISLIPGPQGIQGPAGAQGVQGIPGAVGVPAPVLPAELPEEPEISIIPGPQGIQGFRGPTGPMGIPGLDGEPGEPGLDLGGTTTFDVFNPGGGHQGPAGPQGAQGIAGIAGPPGLDANLDDLELPILGSLSFQARGKIPFGENFLSVYDEVNDRIGIGVAAPSEVLDILRSGSVPVIKAVGDWDVDFMNTQFRFESYSGTHINRGGVFRGMAIRGTQAVPTATGSGDVLAQFIGDGYTNALTTAGHGQLAFVAGSLWSATNAETYLKFQLTANGSVSPVEIGRLKLTTFPLLGLGCTDPGNMIEVSDDAGNAAIRMSNFTASNLPPTLVCVRGRGTRASPALVQSGDLIGDIFQAYGQYDTTVGHLNIGALARASATQNFSSTAAGTKLQFYVTKNSTVTLIEALTLQQDGTVDFPSDPAWIAYTPTVTAGAGTFTTVSATGRSRILGKLVFLQAHIAVTTVGTASADVRITLPTNQNNSFKYMGVGRENAVTGKEVSVQITGNVAIIVFYDNSFPGASSNVIDISAVYEAA